MYIFIHWINKNIPETICYVKNNKLKKIFYKFINRPNWFKLVTLKLGYCKWSTKLSITWLLLILLTTALNPDSAQGFRYLPYLGKSCHPQDWNLWIKIAFRFCIDKLKKRLIMLRLTGLRSTVSFNLNCFIERLRAVHILVRQVCCISFDLICFK